ncbi:MAG: hypothetical protein ABSG32_24315 [Terriglobia bacterium]|jgi:hypothetical protein
MQTYSDDDGRLASSVFSHEVKRPDPIHGHTDKIPEVFAIFPDPLGTLAALQTAKGLAQELEVLVIFTDAAGTLAALQMAEGLAQKLGAHIRLLVPYEVPYTLPLTKPPISVEFLEGQIRDLAGKTRLEVSAHIFLCRDKMRTLKLLLRPHSCVVVGGKKRWWPTSAQRLAQGLQKDGHQVIFAEPR